MNRKKILISLFLSLFLLTGGFESVYAASITEAMAHYNLGKRYFLSEQYPRARQEFGLAVQLDQSRRKSVCRLSRMYLKKIEKLEKIRKQIDAEKRWEKMMTKKKQLAVSGRQLAKEKIVAQTEQRKKEKKQKIEARKQRIEQRKKEKRVRRKKKERMKAKKTWEEIKANLDRQRAKGVTETSKLRRRSASLDKQLVKEKELVQAEAEKQKIEERKQREQEREQKIEERKQLTVGSRQLAKEIIPSNEVEQKMEINRHYRQGREYFQQKKFIEAIIEFELVRSRVDKNHPYFIPCSIYIEQAREGLKKEGDEEN